MTEYRPEAEAEGQYSVTCSNPHFGDKYNAYDLNVIYLILTRELQSVTKLHSALLLKYASPYICLFIPFCNILNLFMKYFSRFFCILICHIQ